MGLNFVAKMNKMKKGLSFWLSLALLLSAVGARAQANFNLRNSKITIAGTSSLHDWESDVTIVRASGAIVVESNVLKSINSLYVEIPVTGIKSSKGSIMDDKTHTALKHKKFPNITYQLTTVNGFSRSGNTYEIKASGNLTIAGSTKPVDMTVKGTVGSDGSIRFEGSKPLKMTDFGIAPPTALLGTLKTGDDITISFSVTLGL